MNTGIKAEVMTDPAPKGWTLKALKHIESMSEETHCFSANLYIDGKKAAEVSNHGHGGPDMIHWTSPEVEKAALATTSGTQDYDGSPFDDLACFEITIGEMVNDALLLKAVKKAVKKSAFPIGVYAEDAPYSGFVFGLRSLDNLDKFLDKYKAQRYRVFHL